VSYPNPWYWLEWTVENVRIDFVEIFPQANLGAAFLRRFVVTVDGKNRRLRLRLRGAGG
jgi:hypothetical protein